MRERRCARGGTWRGLKYSHLTHPLSTGARIIYTSWGASRIRKEQRATEVVSQVVGEAHLHVPIEELLREVQGVLYKLVLAAKRNQVPWQEIL